MDGDPHPRSPLTPDSERLLTRRDFLLLGATVSTSLLAGDAFPQENAPPGRHKPNIIFVFADQLRSHVLGCYGNGQVDTPNLNRIAEEGVRFDNALSTWPVCSPYRAMLLTGTYPMHNGTVSNDTAPTDGIHTIAEICRSQGYETAYIGKWHLEWNREPFVPKDRRRGFDFWASRNCSHQYFDSFYCGDTPDRIALPGYEAEAQARLASDYIREHADKPFCLFLSWGPPHDPYTAPDEYMSAFPAESLAFRGNVDEREIVKSLLETDPSPLPDKIAKKRERRRSLLEDDLALKGNCLRGYYAATRALDDCMEIILNALDETSLSEDTILAFSSDHGDMMGSHRMISKQMPHEESISIPFLLRYPRKVPSGTATDALLTPVDVMPTLLGLAGLSYPDAVDGLDFTDAARGSRSDQRDAALIMKLTHGGNPWIANGVTTWRGVRTKRNTYARLLDRGPWVLYDNVQDPLQLDNQVDRSETVDLQRKLDSLTDRLMAEADDPGDDSTIRTFRAQRKKRSATG